MSAHLLVVCTANVARSPLGAAVLRTHADHRLGAASGAVVVTSAGVNARDGDRAAPGSIACARSWGIDLVDHRSRGLELDEVEDADLVLTMSTRQREAVLREIPGALDHVFTWVELVRLLRGAEVPATDDVGERVRAAARVAHHRRPLLPAPRRDEDVADPFGGPIDAFVEMANLLADGGDVLGPALFGVEQPDRQHLRVVA